MFADYIIKSLQYLGIKCKINSMDNNLIVITVWKDHPKYKFKYFNEDWVKVDINGRNIRFIKADNFSSVGSYHKELTIIDDNNVKEYRVSYLLPSDFDWVERTHITILDRKERKAEWITSGIQHPYLGDFVNKFALEHSFHPDLSRIKILIKDYHITKIRVRNKERSEVLELDIDI